MEWQTSSARVWAQNGTLYFEGDFSDISIIPLRARLIEFARAYEGEKLTADLAKVERIGHTGLGVLDALRQALHGRGIGLVLASPPEAVLRMLVTTRLAQRFEIAL